MSKIASLKWERLTLKHNIDPYQGIYIKLSSNPIVGRQLECYHINFIKSVDSVTDMLNGLNDMIKLVIHKKNLFMFFTSVYKFFSVLTYLPKVFIATITEKDDKKIFYVYY